MAESRDDQTLRPARPAVPPFRGPGSAPAGANPALRPASPPRATLPPFMAPRVARTAPTGAPTPAQPLAAEPPMPLRGETQDLAVAAVAEPSPAGEVEDEVASASLDSIGQSPPSREASLEVAPLLEPPLDLAPEAPGDVLDEAPSDRGPERPEALEEDVWDGVSSYTIQAPDEISPFGAHSRQDDTQLGPPAEVPGTEAASADVRDHAESAELLDHAESADLRNDVEDVVEERRATGGEPWARETPDDGSAADVLAADRLAVALEGVARRVRFGELRAPRFDPRGGDAAALAAALASVMGVEG